MFKISSESELLECFRPFERGDVESLQRHYPLIVRDYLAWLEPSGAKAFLVFSPPGNASAQRRSPLGIVFRRSSSGPVGMCEWCHSVGGGQGIGLLVAAATSTRQVGVHICTDLSCAAKIRGMPGVNDFPHPGSERERIRHLLERMETFARQNLF